MLRSPLLKLTDGKTFADAVITIREPDGVIMMHKDGINKVDFELLDFRTLKQIGMFDERNAKE